MRQEWLEYLQRLDWNTPMTLALASAAVGSVITLAWISARDARERKRQRRETALELALSLESYARTCRTMMHKATWAAAEPAGPMSREASKGVSIPAFAYPDKASVARPEPQSYLRAARVPGNGARRSGVCGSVSRIR